MGQPDLGAIADGIVARDKRAIATALNLVESRLTDARVQSAKLLRAIAGRGCSASGHRVGFTGPPGVGKSTLTYAVARALLDRGRSVGIVAVDPTSVRSGGSLLGDRARMPFSAEDSRVFVRSYATGGESGGLTRAAHAAIAILATAYDVVLVETTGVGQTETDVTLVADTVVLVLQPGSGDTLQFLKAGVMEIPDVLVVQKADHEELARRALSDVRGALSTAHAAGVDESSGGLGAPLLATSARTGLGIEALVDALDAHRETLGARVAERRDAGAVGYALLDFIREHGTHGLVTLGGRQTLRTALSTERARGASAIELTANASERYLAAERATGKA